jgi:hypothetical protein
LGVVVVPADNIVLVSVRFLSNTIVENEHGMVVLDRADMWLDGLPHVARWAFRAGQKALHAVMADVSVE